MAALRCGRGKSGAFFGYLWDECELTGQSATALVKHAKELHAGFFASVSSQAMLRAYPAQWSAASFRAAEDWRRRVDR